jgi:hypothetical protein
MRNTEPAISQDAAGHATAQQPGTDPRDLFALCLRPAGGGQGDND